MCDDLIPPKFACEDFPDFNFQDLIYKPIMQKQEELLKKIVEMITKRPFEIEDAKRCTIIHHPDLERPDYYFAWDGVMVGTVKFCLMGGSFTVTFVPLPKFTKE